MNIVNVRGKQGANYSALHDILKDKYFFGSKPAQAGEVKFRFLTAPTRKN
jgi:hypothetical protein